ncbi:hypothetical protein BH11ACT3_BH11ACT3_10080 [soil metagenome]
MHVLRPLAQRWVASVGRAAGGIPRPRDHPQVHARGRDSDRVLIVGAGIAAGWGVVTHELALPGSLSRALSAVTGRGNVVDLKSQANMTISDAIDQVADWELANYDAIIVCLGIAEALLLKRRLAWRNQMRLLLSIIQSRAPARTQVLVVGIPSIRSTPFLDATLGTFANRHAMAMNQESKILCAGTTDAHFVELSKNVAPTIDSEWGWATATYAKWGNELALVLRDELKLAGPHPQSAHAREAVRQAAVDRLGAGNEGRGARLEDLLTHARRVFGVETATVTLIDHDSLVTLAHSGRTVDRVARQDSICNVAIGSAEATIVWDARHDSRPHGRTLGQEMSAVDFYAGFPIESPTGERLGVLSLFDTHSRKRDEGIDLDLLREFALMVQSELRRGFGGVPPSQ